MLKGWLHGDRTRLRRGHEMIFFCDLRVLGQKFSSYLVTERKAPRKLFVISSTCVTQLRVCLVRVLQQNMYK